MNIANWLSRNAAFEPGHLAIRLEGSEDRTYGELANRVASLAGWLRSKGLEPGARVGILQWNSIELYETLLACFYGGFVAVPMNARLTVRETGQIMGDAGVSALFYGSEYHEHAAAVNEVLLICVGDDGLGLPFEDAVAGGVSYMGPIADDPDGDAWLFYTSGTTGIPKGATLTHRNLVDMVAAYAGDIRRLGPESVVYHCAPLTHGSGLYALPALAAGSSQVISPSRSFDPSHLLSEVSRYGVSDIAFLAPTMLKRMVDAQAAESVDLSSLENIVYGGAPMYVEDLRYTLDVLGPVVTQIFGQAEAPVTISRLTRADHAHAMEEQDWYRLSTAGRAYFNVEVAVRGEDGTINSVGEGEILTRSHVVMRGYWHNDDATAEAIRDGWLHTGDLGRIDDKGHLALLDRNKDVIISGGSNVYPREVEEVLLEYPRVSQVAVVGAPHKEWGETVVAVVVVEEPSDGTLERALDAWCRERLAGYKLPRRYDFVDELPVSSYGKILKREIRAKYWSGHDRQI